jgi:hypothetical protein
MRFHSIYQAMVLLAAGLASAIFVLSLSDGMRQGTQYANGTTIHISLSDPTLEPIIEHGDSTPSSIRKREDDCWGYQLDHGSVDADVDAFVRSVGDKLYFCSHKDHHMDTCQVANGVLVYFCADQNNECAYIISDIIHQGMGPMDAICPAYEASWALFPGNVGERFIVRKYNQNANICI